MTMSENNREVDLTADDGELDASGGIEAEDVEEPEFDPVAEGKEEAKRVLNAVGGDSEYDRAASALAQKQQSVESMSQQHQAAVKNIQALEQRIEGLDLTISRLEDVDDDTTVFQQLEGGVIIEVVDDDTDGVKESLEDARESLTEQIEDLRGQSEALERGVQKNHSAIQYLEMYRDMNEE